MKIMNFISILICTVLISSCANHSYLPKMKNLSKGVYGGYINIKPTSGGRIKGELIAVQNQQLYILSGLPSDKSDRILYQIEYSKIKNYKLKLTKGNPYSWTIPVFTLSTLSHGIFLSISAPVNALTTTLISLSASAPFNLHREDLSYEELKMYARFPAGIPESVDIAKLN